MFIILSYIGSGILAYYLIRHIIKENTQKNMRLEEAKKKLEIIERIKKKIKRAKNLK